MGRWLGILWVALLVANSVFAQNPMGYGRPPGFGPELDREVIARMRDLQNFLRNDLGYTPGANTIRESVLERNFLGWFSLQSAYKDRFRQWHRGLWAMRGITQLGIHTGGMPNDLANENVEYNRRDLGSYHMFQSKESARTKLNGECSALYRIASDYIQRLEARLAFEAQHRGQQPGRVDPDEPRTPITLLDVMSEEEVKRMIERRRQR